MHMPAELRLVIFERVIAPSGEVVFSQQSPEVRMSRQRRDGRP